MPLNWEEKLTKNLLNDIRDDIMQLVLDANILFSALIRAKDTRKLMLNEKITLFTPEFMLYEFSKHIDILEEKTALSKEVLKELLQELILESKLRTFSDSELEDFLYHAKSISPDPDDVPYFALALKLHCGIWSNDKKLKEQTKINVYSTEDIIEYLRK